jgi:hypothetical protein
VIVLASEQGPAHKFIIMGAAKDRCRILSAAGHGRAARVNKLDTGRQRVGPRDIHSRKDIDRMKTRSSSEQRWLISRRSDFWLASGGASLGLLAAIGLILLRGDKEIDALDFVLSEFHLGATYYTVLQRRLWRRLPVDVLLVPLLILALTYGLSMSGQTVLLTSIAMYAAVWHRGRQSLGVARFYQRAAGGPVSPLHDRLFQGAIYLPMAAALLAYTHLAPLEYEGETYLALNLGAELTSVIAMVAASWLIAYFAWALWPKHGERYTTLPGNSPRVHPGEWWVVLAHGVAFASGYVLGASKASFLLVLAVHHEAQYLYFVYAMSRRSATYRATPACCATAVADRGNEFRAEVRHAGAFIAWPVIGFAGAATGGWLALEWLAPLGMGGLFCHYWLDGRIWTRRSAST